ncbi:MAG: hypothetical protein ACFUZC_21085 [Chthoniobacteraceae bacterium]
MRFPKILQSFNIIALFAFTVATAFAADSIQPLTIRGEDFVDPSGHVIRFWGVNLVGCYPVHVRADGIAENLSSLQVNLVRPHHLLRPSLDWNPRMVSGAIVRYRDNSREFDTEALDHFDYLNAVLRKKGIYLSLSVHFSRKYLPGDVEILKSDDNDRTAWRASVKELNSWPWQKATSPNKMLPMVDERAALLDEEFARNLLMHVNPYTGLSYAEDPQVLTIEVRNEASFEYAIICGNKLPDYMQAELVQKWTDYATKAGIAPGDLYRPADEQAREIRSKFLEKLDEDFFNRMKKVVRATGCKAPMTFSNLWQGDSAAEMHARTADHMENHLYMDPLVTGSAADGIYELTKTALAGKPFFVGELNQAEGANNIQAQSPVRTMLPLAASAYGLLQNWSGLVWFAWEHGDSMLADDGWAQNEGRASQLGSMVNDGMMIDHIRTAGIIFRRGLVAKSREPQVMAVDAPLAVRDYKSLMRGKYSYMPGWQNIHGMRKVFGMVPAQQHSAPWMTASPENPIISDTGEIVKDIQRKQVSVSAPQAEAFSGFLDSRAPAALKRLRLEGENGFVTVILVADDGKPIEESSSLVISRTALDASHAETSGPRVRLMGMKKPIGDLHWTVRLTRPRAAASLMKDFDGVEYHPLTIAADGSVELPLADWHECELSLRK